MDLTMIHVVAACAALAVGTVLLVARKGSRRHVLLGRLYVAVMLAVNVPVFFVYDETGRVGVFHALAAVSLLTTALGWLSVRRRPSSPGAHAALMTWSWVGVVTAGLAQFANGVLPQQAPSPVLAVIVLTTALGLVGVPRFVASHARQTARAQPTSSGRAVSASCR